jgi:hypothetical protein
MRAEGFHNVKTRREKLTVIAWLRDLPNRYQAYSITPQEEQSVKSPLWVAGCLKLIKSMLEAEPEKDTVPVRFGFVID